MINILTKLLDKLNRFIYIKKDGSAKNRASDLLVVPVYTHIDNINIKLGILCSDDDNRFYHMFHYVAKEHNSVLKAAQGKLECHIGSTATSAKNIYKIAEGGFKAGVRQLFGCGQYFSYIGYRSEVLSSSLESNSYYDKVREAPSGDPNGEATTSFYAQEVRDKRGIPATLVAKVHALVGRPIVTLDAIQNHKAAFDINGHYNTSAVIMKYIENTNTQYLIANSPKFGGTYRLDMPMPEVIGCNIASRDLIL